jgi:osmotically-inducible protein OsmY
METQARHQAVLWFAKRTSDSVDETLESLVQSELGQSPYAEIRNVSCKFSDGILVLSGRVPTYYLKQVAQRLALQHLRGVVSVDNQLTVDS